MTFSFQKTLASTYFGFIKLLKVTLYIIIKLSGLATNRGVSGHALGQLKHKQASLPNGSIMVCKQRPQKKAPRT